MIELYKRKEHVMTDAHYILTDETKTVDGVVLYRIRATRDLPRHDVKAGDLGGWVEGTHNLLPSLPDQRFDPWIADEAIVMGQAVVRGHAIVAHEAIVEGHADIYERARVDGRARVKGSVRVLGDAHITQKAVLHDNVRVEGHAVVGGYATILGSITIQDHVIIRGATTLSNNVSTIQGRALIESSLDIMSLTIEAHHVDYATLTKTRAGTPYVHAFDFKGSLDKFEEEAREGTLSFMKFTDDRCEEELLAICALFRARAKRWSK